ncbi:MAG: metallophosphoesterase family protein [Chloroflexi bacterium]|nr:metallophosphoesterase family protein [Chloroflexota bacterium]
MRIALISDIHGNLVSFQAVMAALEREPVDQIICLGDVATLGPQPRQVMEHLIELDMDTVLGNHDTFLLKPELSHTYMNLDWFSDTIHWCAEQLLPSDFDYLRKFRPLIEVPLENHASLLCFHGSPRSNIDNILATTPPDELDEMLTGHRATIMACGHTHVQMLRQHKGQTIINVGSVGMPFEMMPFTGEPRILPWAEYAFLNWSDAVVNIELRRVPVDVDAVREAALASGMPRAADWVNNWIIPDME